jgi:hypothetical protein
MAQQHARLSASGAFPELCPHRVEQRIMAAYVQLAAVLDHSSSPRTVTVFWVGSLEVSLTEAAQNMIVGLPPLQLELRSPESGAILDSLGCYDFDEGELAAAVEFILDAMRRVRTLH